MSVLKLTEWQSGSGLWNCADTSKLAQDSGNWLHAMRVTGLTPADYIQWAIDFCNPIIHYNKEKNLVFFSWEKQSDMRKFKNKINQEARIKNYQI